MILIQHRYHHLINQLQLFINNELVLIYVGSENSLSDRRIIMAKVEKTMEKIVALAKARGQYGRFADAAKVIDPRKD